MGQKFALWIVTQILEWLFGKAKTEANKAIDKHKEDKLNEVIDNDNVKKYEEATSRADRIQAAQSLLSGIPSKP